MTVYEILSAPKSDAPTEAALRAALAKHKPGCTVENITTDGSSWTVRIATKTADKPDFLKKKDEGDDADSSDSVDDADSDSESDSDTSDSADDDSGSDEDGDGDKKKKSDPVAEVKNVINQLTTLFQDLGGKVQDLQSAHDDKAQKLKDIGDTVGGEDGPGGGLPGLPPGLEGDGSPVGPVPGGPKPPGGPDARKRPVPPMPGGGVPAFTHRYEVATHPGIDSEGNKISLTAAASAMESDPNFTEYEVVGMTENTDGTFSAKLRRKD